MTKKKKSKTVVVETSLDRFIKQYEEVQKSVKKTPAEMAEVRQEKKKLKAMEPSARKTYKKRQQEQYQKDMATKYEEWKKEEAEKRERALKAAIARDSLEFSQVPLRKNQLQDTVSAINKIHADLAEFEKECIVQYEWDYYLSCKRLPYPESYRNLSNYIYYWKEEVKEIDLEKTIQRSEDAAFLLQLIETYGSKNDEKNWKLRIQEIQRILQQSLNYATYHIIKDMKDIYKDPYVADFVKETKWFLLGLWTKLTVPIPFFNPVVVPPEPSCINFDPFLVKIEIPGDIDMTQLVVRFMVLKYDHISEYSKNFHDPDIPIEYGLQMDEFLDNLWLELQKIKFKRRKGKDKNEEKLNVITFPENLSTLRIDYNPLEEPLPQEELVRSESLKFNEIPKRFSIEEQLNQINLREFMTIGDIFLLNLLVKPRQPRDFIKPLRTVARVLPKKLNEFPYKINVDEPKEPQEIQNHELGSMVTLGIIDETSQLFEALTKNPIQEKIEASASAERILNTERQKLFDKMISVELGIPRNVYWFQKPVLCHWNIKLESWENNHVHNYKVNENSVNFQVGRSGYFSFLTHRYLCFPFNDWSLTPGSNQTVTFTLVTQLYKIDLTIKGNEVALTEVCGLEKTILEERGIFRNFFPFSEFKQKMRCVGLNFFSSYDTTLYVEKTSPKNWILERHLYYCMALMIIGCEFKFSKWSIMTLDRLTIFLQVRDVLQKNFKLLLVDINRSCYVRGKEDDPELDKTPLAGYHFAADPYQLWHSSSHNKHDGLPKELPATLFKLLSEIRPITFTYPSNLDTQPESISPLKTSQQPSTEFEQLYETVLKSDQEGRLGMFTMKRQAIGPSKSGQTLQSQSKKSKILRIKKTYPEDH